MTLLSKEWIGILNGIQEIRDRYSEVNRKLIIARAGPGDHSYKADLYKFAYDKCKRESRCSLLNYSYSHDSYVIDKDTQRRKHLVNLYERTAEQIHQEEVLFRELKRREANEESWLRERESLLRRLKESENIPAGSQFLVPGEGLVKVSIRNLISLSRVEADKWKLNVQKKRKTSRDESGQKRKRTFADSSAVDLSADGILTSRIMH